MAAPTMEDMPVEWNPVHLLAIADSKVGKSTYAARAAADGMRVLYIDSDNGSVALSHALKDNPEAKKRVHLVKTENPIEFLIGFFRSTPQQPLRWNVTLDRSYSMSNVGQTPDDVLYFFNARALPPELLIVIDSWTSLAGDALGIGAKVKGIDLINIKEDQQGIYGEAGNRLTLITNYIQKIHCHVMVIAHGTFYERYEKPTGKTQREMKQHEMVLRDVIQVPFSSSRPHGFTMASRFNHVGWLEIDRMENVFIDFRRRPDRVGGGPPNNKFKLTDLPFVKLVNPTDGTVVDPGHSDSWFTAMTIGEMLAVAEARKTQSAPANKTASPAQASNTPAVPTAGVAQAGTLSQLKGFGAKT